nr:MAG TPA: hypothetical protein [Caudoviricetes sp.]
MCTKNRNLMEFKKSCIFKNRDATSIERYYNNESWNYAGLYY